MNIVRDELTGRPARNVAVSHLFALLYSGLLVCVTPSSVLAAAAMNSSDLTGDTFGVGPVQHDIVAVDSALTDNELTLDIKFAGNISQPTTFHQNVLAGYIDLDVDGNPATGITSHITQSGHGPTGLGVDFFIDLFSEADAYLPDGTTPRMPGKLDLVDTFTVTTSAVLPAIYEPTSVSISIPRSLVPTATLPIRWGIIVGTLNEGTDLLIGATIPEPATLISVIVGGAAIISNLRGRKPRSA